MRYWVCWVLGMVMSLSLGAAERSGMIAIVAAYPGENEAQLEMIEGVEIHETRTINGVRFDVGEVQGKPVVFFITGISTINAAMTTQLALSNFPIETLLFSGIAGGINPALEKGDLAIPARWAYHAEGAYYNPDPDAPRGYHIPDWATHDLANYKMFFPASVTTRRGGMTQFIEKPFFEADPDLVALAASVAEEIELTAASGEPAEIIVGGVGVAGPIFMDNADYRRFVRENWGADALDMESTAIAHVCWSNDVPCLIIRCLSDLAGGQEGTNDLAEFSKMAEQNAARFLNALLKRL